MSTRLNGPTESPLIKEETVSRHMSFIGQRADKAIVEDVSSVENLDSMDGVITTGVVKRVIRYTLECSECGGAGYYDQRGEVICDGCGMVLSNRDAVVKTEFSEGEGNAPGSSRGLEKMHDGAAGRGTHEPSI